MACCCQSRAKSGVLLILYIHIFKVVESRFVIVMKYNAMIVHIKVMVVGGLTNNILAPQYVEKQHAEKVNNFLV